jgi:GTPase SAR1 family protein
VVSTKQGDELAKKFGCTFLEASARTRENIDEIFYSLVRQINPPNKRTKKKADKGGGGGCLIL